MTAILTLPHCDNLFGLSITGLHDDMSTQADMEGLEPIIYKHPANERWHYIVMLALIGWVHTQNDPANPS